MVDASKRPVLVFVAILQRNLYDENNINVL